ncbi:MULTISPECIES: DUF6985 domain-containing protein [Brevibacillus]|uniref:DUF6985 domain-containing protein n=1 Tax=Brevibacillus TaxID=55080 RepID=UPI000D0EDECA|nr:MULTISPECIES: DUF2004 domain-containing protein [Brevibacillus]PSJ59033.1 DUF2004 domain-containing protein [Brevibacillus brevis]RED20900.1 uncharacterized protein DUF2004 [Brevibacillus brevis]TQK62566.1 uncharacterized protein DUF2004 [Brevibacillus sp. AG162]VEF87816.1 Uncharacterised protein [Brevibacillus brevis]GEC93727.1 hypothetical protein BBR01nite_60580 [Brevibacillus brevis]
MTINDAVFGELEYNYAWFKDTTIEFCGEEVEIALMISGEQDGKFSEKQYAAYHSLIQSWEQLQQSILQPILDYYEQNYDAGLNENYPLIETAEQLLDYISLVGISIPFAKGLEGRYIGLTFDCTWDEENGLGLLLINEEVARVGYQDVAM